MFRNRYSKVHMTNIIDLGDAKIDFVLFTQFSEVKFSAQGIDKQL